MKTCYIDMNTRSIADLAQPGELHKGWTITRINVPAASRGTGQGTILLDRICADADAEAATLYLEISPSGGLSYHQLRAWYERRGFRRLQSGYYKRQPRKAT